MRGWYVFVLGVPKRRELCDLHHKALIKAATYSPLARSTIGAEGLNFLFGMGRGGTPSFITTYFFMTQHTSFNVHLVNFILFIYTLVIIDLGDRVKCVSDFL